MTDKPALPTLSDETKAILRRAFATRGPKKGLLLASAPKQEKDPLAYAAWHGAMSVSNPFKSGIGAALWIAHNPEMQAVYKEVQDYLDARPHLARVLDRDRAALESHGVW